MLPDRVSNPGPLTHESGALPIALRGLALAIEILLYIHGVLTEKPNSKPYECNIVYIPISTSSHVTSVTSNLP